MSGFSKVWEQGWIWFHLRRIAPGYLHTRSFRMEITPHPTTRSTPRVIGHTFWKHADPSINGGADQPLVAVQEDSSQDGNGSNDTPITPVCMHSAEVAWQLKNTFGTSAHCAQVMIQSKPNSWFYDRPRQSFAACASLFQLCPDCPVRPAYGLKPSRRRLGETRGA